MPSGSVSGYVREPDLSIQIGLFGLRFAALLGVAGPAGGYGFYFWVQDSFAFEGMVVFKEQMIPVSQHEDHQLGRPKVHNHRLQLLFCRLLVAAIHKSKRAQHEARELQIEQDLRQADLKAVLAKLEHDMCLLEERMPSEEAEALKHAKDMRYLSWRQQQLDICLLSISPFFPKHLSHVLASSQKR